MIWLAIVSSTIFIICIAYLILNSFLKVFLNSLVFIIKELLESLGIIIFESYKLITFTIPDYFSGRARKRKKEKKMKEALEKAIEEKEEYLRELRGTSDILSAAINRAKYLKNKYPYASDEMIEDYIREFYNSSVGELIELEKVIQKNHIENAQIYNNQFSKVYTLSDLISLEPISEINEYPFEMKLFKIGPDFVVYIHDTIDNTDTLFQTRDEDKIKQFIAKTEYQFNILKERNRILNNKGGIGKNENI